MNHNYQKALDCARTVDLVVEEIREKYRDSKTALRGKDWLFEYAVLNWGTDFLRPYQALVQMQESLEKNVGNWGVHDSYINGNSLCKFTNGDSKRWDYVSTRRIVLFQVSSRLLVPRKIQRLPASNPERTNGYKVEMGIGMEPEILIFDFADKGNWGYMKNAGDSCGLLIESDNLMRYLRKVANDQFESSTPQVLVGLTRSTIYYFGSSVEEKLAEWLGQNGRMKGEKPINFIRRQKERSQGREDFYPPMI